MQVTFLGGANEIGASCALLDIAGVRVMVDCGQRLNARPGEELPDFSQLEQGPPLAAVVLTHAHTDHVGALPALAPFLPDDCPILATEPTLELARLMLQDTVNINTRYRQGAGQLPMFPAAMLARVLDRFRPVRWGKAERLSADVRATWFPSGHLLGAAMIEIRAKQESAIFSGDLSIADQATVSGAFVPAAQPDVLVLESTYGNRLHAHRPTQEQKIVERVRDCISQGGRVLFPTFALGRAQEVLMLLGLAMRRGELDKFPVFADGMVRKISQVYSRFPEELALPARQVWSAGHDPIFPDDLPILPVRDNAQREHIAVAEPCVMVASSGMLQGGASQFYASHWVKDPRNLIMITGYQDEESPGEALRNLAAVPSGEPRFFKLGGVRTEVHCQVESFSLSAHADNLELVSLADKLKPKLTLLVHGDEAAREMLSNSLAAAIPGNVECPENGRSYTPSRKASRRPRVTAPSRINPLALWPPWDPVRPRDLDLAEIHHWLSTLSPRPAWVTLDELSDLWKSPEPVSAQDLETLRQAIAAQPKPYFVPEPRRPYLLHLTPPENLRDDTLKATRLPAERAGRMLRELLPGAADLRRMGFYPDEGVLQLEFRFPQAALSRYGNLFVEFLHRTGWAVQVESATRDADLHAAASTLLPEVEGESLSISHQERRVIASASSSPESADLVWKFKHQTGYDLGFAAPGINQR